MKHTFAKLAVACAFMAAGAAQATVSPVLTINTGESITYAGWTVSNARGTGTLTFDKTLVSALNLAGIKMSAIAPATLDAPLNAAGTKYTTISAASTITSGSGIFDTDTQILKVVGISSVGGATLTATADDATNTGGFLSIKNIGADLTTNTIYADVSGANGVTSQRLAMWTFQASGLTGQTSFPAVVGTTTSTNTVSGLTITSGAFDYFAVALGLNDFGKTAMGGIKDYGTFKTVISMDVAKAAAVPEPSTYALMGLGLVGIAFASRRKAA